MPQFLITQYPAACTVYHAQYANVLNVEVFNGQIQIFSNDYLAPEISVTTNTLSLFNDQQKLRLSTEATSENSFSNPNFTLTSLQINTIHYD